MEKEYTGNSIRFLSQGAEKALILEEADKDVITVSLSGELTGEVANVLLDEMTALIVAGQGLVVNLEKTVYISASVMEVLLRMEKRLEEKNKYMQIVQAPQEIYNEFKARGLHELLDIEVMKK